MISGNIRYDYLTLFSHSGNQVATMCVFNRRGKNKDNVFCIMCLSSNPEKVFMKDFADTLWQTPELQSNCPQKK